jgi:hypothetical protein
MSETRRRRDVRNQPGQDDPRMKDAAILELSDSE